MPTVDAQSFLDGLDALLTDLRSLEPHPSQQATQQLYQKYRQLHEQARALSKGALRRATADQKKMVDFLDMGKENYEAFMRKLVAHIQPTAQATAMAVAEFLKSPAAFRHLRARLRSTEEDEGFQVSPEQEHLDREAVRKIVGGMLGVEVSEDFVLSIRGEMAGKLVTYSLSELCEDDLKAWEDPAIQKHWNGSRDHYLLDCIRHHDMVMTYSMGAHDKATSTYPIGCVIYSEEDEARRKPSHQADSCMVNHRKKLIVFGAQTTKNKHDADQAMSAVRMFSALEQMVAQPTLGDPAVPNPYYGYAILPSFLHAGYFPADRSEGRKVVGQAFLDTLESAGERLNDEDRHTLARQAFFNVFSERHPNIALAETWARFNVQVCGADTLPLFHDMKAALEAEHPLRRFSEIVLDGTVGALEVLARDNVFVSSKSRGQNVMEPILEGILATLENHAMNFACIPDAQGKLVGLSQAERTQLAYAASHLDKLRTKILDDNPGDHQKMCGRMARLARDIRSGSFQEDFLDPEHRKRPNFLWDNPIYNALSERHGDKATLEGESYIEAVWQSLARAIADRKVHPVLLAARDAALKDLGNQDLFKQGLIAEVLAYIGEPGRRLRKLSHAENPKAYADFHSTFTRMDPDSIGSVLAKGIRSLYSRGSLRALKQGESDKPSAAGALRDLVNSLITIGSLPGGEKVSKVLLETARKEQAALLKNSSPTSRRPKA